jgi:hypothetical protein
MLWDGQTFGSYAAEPHLSNQSRFVAGQIAKIKGCKVIGTAGGQAKCDWLTTEAAFDRAIGYRSEDSVRDYRRSAPTASTYSWTMSAPASSKRF